MRWFYQSQTQCWLNSHSPCRPFFKVILCYRTECYDPGVWIPSTENLFKRTTEVHDGTIKRHSAYWQVDFCRKIPDSSTSNISWPLGSMTLRRIKKKTEKRHWIHLRERHLIVQQCSMWNRIHGWLLRISNQPPKSISGLCNWSELAQIAIKLQSPWFINARSKW